MRLVQLYLAWQRRARANKGHLPSQHVPQLRQLVEACAPEPTAELRRSRITQNLEEPWVAVHTARKQLVPVRLCAVHHRPELEDLEKPPSLADPILREEHGAR